MRIPTVRLRSYQPDRQRHQVHAGERLGGGACLDGGDGSGCRLHLVSDTGRGIPQESLPQVFERLYQDPDSVDDSRAGLGLGLFIAKEIVTLHGGRMWLQANLALGSTFSFTLPLYFPGQASAPSDPLTRAACGNLLFWCAWN